MTSAGAGAGARFFGVPITPLTRRRLDNFKANKRGYWSFWIFLGAVRARLFAEVIANDKPLLIRYDGGFYTPVFARPIRRPTFGGDFELEADYRDPYIQELIAERAGCSGRWSGSTYRHGRLGPASPGADRRPIATDNWLGTDDQGARRDVARLIYGFRISVLFGLALTIVSAVIGVAAGRRPGLFRRLTDLLAQRFIEIWSGMPQLYILIIMASVIEPNFWWLLGMMLLFSWIGFVGVVRAEFLRARNFDTCAPRGRSASATHDHVPPRAAQCHGGHADLPAVHSGRIGHDADRARLPRLRPAARLAVAGRTVEAGQGQPAGALARPHRLLRRHRRSCCRCWCSSARRCATPSTRASSSPGPAAETAAARPGAPAPKPARGTGPSDGT